MTTSITIADYGNEIRWIEQEGVPFHTPLGLPVVNPLSDKRMQFLRQYKVTGITLDEALTGIVFCDYRTFLDIKEQTFDRARRTRHVVFNPFTKELRRYGGLAGDVGAVYGEAVADLLVRMLGLITWDISEDPRTEPSVGSVSFGTTSRLFGGHFKIRVRTTVDGGVIIEDDWTSEAGSDMHTSFMAMANLVLLTHPRGFEHIADELVEEIRRAREAGRPYTGEIE